MLKYSLNQHLKNNSLWPPGHQNLLLKIMKTVNSREHFPQNFFQQMLWRLSAIAKKCPSSKIELKLNSLNYSKAGHCKKLSDLTHKIYSKILQKVRLVTSITNTFLKTSEGRLFPERLRHIFSRVFIHICRNFWDCYSFCYYSDKKYDW